MPNINSYAKSWIYNKKGKRLCYRCGDFKHLAKDCRGSIRCFECGFLGHKKFECKNVTKSSKFGRDSLLFHGYHFSLAFLKIRSVFNGALSDSKDLGQYLLNKMLWHFDFLNSLALFGKVPSHYNGKDKIFPPLPNPLNSKDHGYYFCLEFLRFKSILFNCQAGEIVVGLRLLDELLAHFDVISSAVNIDNGFKHYHNTKCMEKGMEASKFGDNVSGDVNKNARLLKSSGLIDLIIDSCKTKTSSGFCRDDSLYFMDSFNCCLSDYGCAELWSNGYPDRFLLDPCMAKCLDSIILRKEIVTDNWVEKLSLDSKDIGNDLKCNAKKLTTFDISVHNRFENLEGLDGDFSEFGTESYCGNKSGTSRAKTTLACYQDRKHDHVHSYIANPVVNLESNKNVVLASISNMLGSDNITVLAYANNRILEINKMVQVCLNGEMPIFQIVDRGNIALECYNKRKLDRVLSNIVKSVDNFRSTKNAVLGSVFNMLGFDITAVLAYAYNYNLELYKMLKGCLPDYDFGLFVPGSGVLVFYGGGNMFLCLFDKGCVVDSGHIVYGLGCCMIKEKFLMDEFIQLHVLRQPTLYNLGCLGWHFNGSFGAGFNEKECSGSRILPDLDYDLSFRTVETSSLLGDIVDGEFSGASGSHSNRRGRNKKYVAATGVVRRSARLRNAWSSSSCKSHISSTISSTEITGSGMDSFLVVFFPLMC